MIDFKITKENGKWLVDGKQYNELNYDEILALDEFIIDYQTNQDIYKAKEIEDISITSKKLQEAYELLQVYKGAKERAHEIHGISGTHFRKLLTDTDTPQDTMQLMYRSVRQSAKEALDNLKRINVIISN